VHQPPAGTAVVYDAVIGRVVLYGPGLWTWDGGDWSLVR
jgi:hypothetical protein